MGTVASAILGGLTEGEHIEHYGVKGMRWGVRKDGGAGSSRKRKPAKEGESADSARKSNTNARAKRSGTKALSNKELQDAITRMQLEQNYKRLAVNEKPAIQRFVASTLLDIGKQTVTNTVRSEVNDRVNNARSK